MDELDLDIRIAEQISSLWLDEPTSLLEAGTEFSGAQWVQGFGENRSSLVVLLFQLFFRAMLPDRSTFSLGTWQDRLLGRV